MGRLREVCQHGDYKMTGEIDQTYIGDTEKNRYANKRLNAGRGGVGKQTVIGERDGRAALGATVYTDDLRGYNGTFHNVSTKHLHHYLNEGNVKIDTSDRMASLAKRLIYAELIK